MSAPAPPPPGWQGPWPPPARPPSKAPHVFAGVALGLATAVGFPAAMSSAVQLLPSAVQLEAMVVTLAVPPVIAIALLFKRATRAIGAGMVGGLALAWIAIASVILMFVSALQGLSDWCSQL